MTRDQMSLQIRFGEKSFGFATLAPEAILNWPLPNPFKSNGQKVPSNQPGIGGRRTGKNW